MHSSQFLWLNNLCSFGECTSTSQAPMFRLWSSTLSPIGVLQLHRSCQARRASSMLAGLVKTEAPKTFPQRCAAYQIIASFEIRVNGQPTSYRRGLEVSDFRPFRQLRADPVSLAIGRASSQHNLTGPCTSCTRMKNRYQYFISKKGHGSGRTIYHDRVSRSSLTFFVMHAVSSLPFTWAPLLRPLYVRGYPVQAHY